MNWAGGEQLWPKRAPGFTGGGSSLPSNKSWSLGLESRSAFHSGKTLASAGWRQSSPVCLGQYNVFPLLCFLCSAPSLISRLLASLFSFSQRFLFLWLPIRVHEQLFQRVYELSVSESEGSMTQRHIRRVQDPTWIHDIIQFWARVRHHETIQTPNARCCPTFGSNGIPTQRPTCCGFGHTKGWPAGSNAKARSMARKGPPAPGP